MSGCDLVFADPDNGLFRDDRFEPTRKDSAKRIPLAEAKTLAHGRTAVIYHHNTRVRGGHDQEIREWMRRLPGCTCAYYWRRWSNRTFFIVNPDDEIEHRLTAFTDLWGAGGQLVRDGAGLRHRVHISRGAGDLRHPERSTEHRSRVNRLPRACASCQRRGKRARTIRRA